MDLIVLVGLVSGITSIVTLFVPIPKNSLTQKVGIALALVFLTLLCGKVVSDQQMNDQKKRVRENATILLETYEQDFTQESFIHAALTFLETNKDVYPDSYIRAKQIAKRIHLLEDDLTKEATPDEIVDAAYNIQGILQQIAIWNSVNE